MNGVEKLKNGLAPRSALRNFGTVVAVIAVCEALVMAVLRVADLGEYWPLAVDPLLLAALSSPLLYALIVVPLRRSLDASKRIEGELREERDYSQGIIEGTQAIVLILDTEGRIQHFNPYLEEVSGYRLEDVKGKDWFETFLPERDHGRIRAVFAKAVSDVATRGNVNPIVTKDGEEREIEWYDKTMKDDEGNISGVLTVGHDITERKRAEEALRETEARMELALRSADLGIWDLNLETGTMTLSERSAEMLGYTMAELEPQLNTWLVEVVHPDDRTRRAEVWDAHVRGKTDSYQIELRMRHKSGRWVWVLDTGRILERFADGQPLRVCGTHLDITQRKQAEEALRESERLLRESQEVARIGSLDLSIPSFVWRRSEGLEKIFGIDEDYEPSLDGWVALIHPDWQQVMNDYYLREVLEERKPFDKEYKIVRYNDHAVRWVQGLGGLEFDDEGNPVRMIGTIQDITERKLAEEKLRESEEKYRLLADNATDLITVTDLQGTTTYVSPSVFAMRGYTVEETLHQRLEERMTPASVDLVQTTMAREFGDATEPGGNRARVVTLEVETYRKDGSTTWIEIQTSLMVDSDSAPVGFLSVSRDITDRKQAEAEREKLEGQLRHKQKMEAVGQLAGGVAHDFNNLLQAILGYGEMALDEAGADTPIRASVEEVLKAGERARTLVSQLLAFSRRQVLDMQDIDLSDVIADVTKMIRRMIGEHITLDTIAGHDLGMVRADPGQIAQILMNLCVNARDAMPTGGTITIETENVLVDEAFCRAHSWATPGRYVLLSVTDTGCGMDKEELDNVFEPFFTTKEVGKGTGLGLATVYGLVKQHQGMIHVYSEVDEGTIFKIYLPLVEGSAVAVDDRTEAPVPGGTETILLAEDDELVRNLTKTILEEAGYTVLAAVDGEAALRVFEDHGDEISLALLDVMMPKLGGRAVFERIQGQAPQVRVLFSSGYSMNAIHTSFVLDEGLMLIQKPYQRAALLRRVREALDS